MKHLSFWAKHNPAKARLLIILSETISFLLAARLGILLLRWDVPVRGIAVAVPLSLMVVSFVIARRIRTTKRRGTKIYWRQRLSYFLMGLSMFVLTTFFVSSEKLLTWNTYSPLSGSTASVLILPAPSASQRTSVKGQQKATRLLKKMRKSSWLKWLWVFLIVAVGLFAITLIAALSCSLSCDGNGVAAILVLALGIVGVVWLCVWSIQKILKGKAPKKVQPASPVPPSEVSIKS